MKYNPSSDFRQTFDILRSATGNFVVRRQTGLKFYDWSKLSGDAVQRFIASKQLLRRNKLQTLGVVLLFVLFILALGVVGRSDVTMGAL